ncbi:hypothetical protein [Amycolatopsis albispora]|uniref:Uncharacterized protein n=1 Tax=Amycolatopsis albispora TaxID=1804986 RepID=A0A344L957_9PSEU|nr:hypothetical protein [Amycolatopsis albispora]AXB44581.1 hypothetical protein A4R43_20450 [Amycolatopsis albispora]
MRAWLEAGKRLEPSDSWLVVISLLFVSAVLLTLRGLTLCSGLRRAPGAQPRSCVEAASSTSVAG